MTQQEPDARPDAEYARKQFNGIAAKLPYASKRWRLKPVKTGLLSSFSLGIASVTDELLYHGNQIAGKSRVYCEGILFHILTISPPHKVWKRW